MMALISCPDCGKSISDKAPACPNCGAPNPDSASPGSFRPAPQNSTGGTLCPFSGHFVPEGATVCECGAYYGYKGGVMTDQKFFLLLKLVTGSIVLFLLGLVFEWQLGTLLGGAGLVIFGVVFVFFGLPTKLQGKQWWHQR
jgi:hypothetical protein